MLRLGNVFPAGVVSTHRGLVPTDAVLGGAWTVVLVSEGVLDEGLIKLLQSVVERFTETPAFTPGLILLSRLSVADIRSALGEAFDQCETLDRFYVLGARELHGPDMPWNLVDPLALQIALGSSMPSQGLGVCIIGPDHRVKLSLNLPDAAMLNLAELERSLLALRLTDTSPLATPADWQKGQSMVVKTELSDLEATERYGPIQRIFAYLRFVAMPKSAPDDL